MKKLFSLMLATLLLFGLAACGNDGADEPESTPDHQITLPGEDVVEPEPEPEPEPLNQAFLTGLEKGADYPEGKRITAVMVNNIASSRPTRGLTEAKVLYEIKVEGGITRFMALFEDYETMPTVGGVRSARDQFLQLLLPYWGFYIHDGPGGAHPVNEMLGIHNYGEFDLQPNTGSTFRLDRPGMPSEYTEYTDGEHITSAVENTSADDARNYGSPIFNFRSYNEEARKPADGEASEVAIVHSASYRTLMSYNSGTGRYEMSQFSSSGGVNPTVDENNNQQLMFDNVVVLFAPMQLYNASELVKVNYSDGGAGFVFTQGGYELILWRKGAPQDPLALYKWEDNGEMVELNPGTTYVAVVDDANLPDFDATLKAGTASEEVAAGVVNPNEQDAED